MNRKVNWSIIDWNLQDIDISERFSVSRERVRQMRKVVGFSCVKSRKRRIASKRDLILSYNSYGKGLGDIVLELGCSENYAKSVLRKSGKSFRHRKSRYNWDLFPDNWESMTDGEIAKVIGVDNPMVVCCWRLRNGYVKRGKSS